MNKKSGILLVATFLGVAGAVTSACSSSFSDCKDQYTCGSSGSGGDQATAGSADVTLAGAGPVDTEAGAAGAASEPACTVDADCDDHDPCTGTEQCKDSACVPGTSPCTNPDATNCDVICSNNAGKAKCTVVGQDADGDMHLSAACAAAPGDDCDDTNATVHPGAPEICDGLDNDCNGLVDLYDGLMIADTTKTFAALGHTATQPQVVWEPASALYGVTWVFATDGSTTESVAFAAFDIAGNTVVSPRIVQSADGVISDAHIAVGSGVFGIIWAVDYTNGQHAVAFNRVSSAGVVNPSTLYPLPSGTDHGLSPRLTVSPSGNWILAWLEYATSAFSTSMNSVLVDGSDKLTPKLAIAPVGNLLTFDVASSAQDFLTADVSAGGNPFGTYLSVGVRSPDASTSIGYATRGDDSTVQQPLVAAGDSDFLVAWSDDGVTGKAGLLTADGTITCGPLDLPVNPQSVLWAGDSVGYVISDGLFLENLSSMCMLSGPIAGATGFVDRVSTVAGSDSTGYAIASATNFDKVNGVTTLSIRAVTPALCK